MARTSRFDNGSAPKNIYDFENADHARRSLVVNLKLLAETRELQQKLDDPTSQMYTLDPIIRECLDTAAREYHDRTKLARKAYARLKEDDADPFANASKRSGLPSTESPKTFSDDDLPF